jgi:hypothetical protein
VTINQIVIIYEELCRYPLCLIHGILTPPSTIFQFYHGDQFLMAETGVQVVVNLKVTDVCRNVLIIFD